MEKITAWLSDKKNMPVVVAGFSIVLVLAILFVLKTMGMIGGSTASMPMQQMSPDASMPSPVDQGAAPVTPASPVPATPGQPGAPVTPPSPTPAPGQPGAPGATQVATAGVIPPMLPYRKDPFLPLGGFPTRKDVMSMVLPALRRPRIAPAPVAPPRFDAGPSAAEVMPPQPFRRMAGVLWNGKISAILETNGETDVVRPGSEITRGNSRVRVESIQQDSIILKTLDTKTPFYVRVTMSGAVVGPNAPGQQVTGGPSMDMGGAY